MDSITLFGWTASVITVVYTAFGLPIQIYKNYKHKTAEGLSKIMVVLLFFTFLSWTVYAFIKKDYYILVPNIIGFFCQTIILVQVWIYRSK